jgi:four helix bundle protein
MDAEEFKRRTKQVGLRVINLSLTLREDFVGRAIGSQIVRSATSVGANYRASCRARSTNEKIAKLKIVEEEADETLYWLEVLVEANLVKEKRVLDLMQEIGEIIAMTVSSIKTLKNRAEAEKEAAQKSNRQSSIGNRQ